MRPSPYRVVGFPTKEYDMRLRNKLRENTPELSKVFCPRCGRPLMYKDQALNALSRRDNKTYICTSCGSSEAVKDYTGLEDDLMDWSYPSEGIKKLLRKDPRYKAALLEELETAQDNESWSFIHNQVTDYREYKEERETLEKEIAKCD